jgi:plastocyanin
MAKLIFSAALAAFLLAAVSLSPRPAAAADVVIFTTGTPNPATVTIAVTDRVTWRNLSSSAHSVAAENNGFPGFSLDPNASHSQQFSKVGHYPYQIDGKSDGVIEVIAAGPTTAGPTSKVSVPPQSKDCTLTILHYDVLVYGYRRFQITFSDKDIPGPGVLTRTAEWSESLPDFMIGVERCHATGLPSLTIALVTPDSLDVHHDNLVPGEIQGTFDYSDTQPLMNNVNSPCQFHIELSFRGKASLFGQNWPPPGHANLDFDSQPENYNDPGSQISSAFVGECNKNGENRNMPGGDNGEGLGSGIPLQLVNGVYFSINEFILGFGLPKGPMAFPLDALAAGNEFNVDSGLQTPPLPNYSNQFHQDTVTDRVVVSFSPRK